MKTAVIRLLPSLLLAACIALVLRFEPFSSSDSGFVFEAQLAADSTAEMHLFFDFGSGFRRESTRDFWMIESAQPRTYRISLPRSIIRSLSIASTENLARFKLFSARILDPEGRVIISLAEPNAAWAPGFAARLAQPLSTIPPEEASWTWSVIQFAALTALFALLSRWMTSRETSWRERHSVWWKQRWKWCEAHPSFSLFVVAILAVIVSCHPVIFFGKSFASPNNGALCLYDSFPTIPGAAASPVETWNGSDVRALFQAHLPYSHAQREAIFRDHELPLWLRGDLCGVTLLGQGMSMIGDPLHWITIAADGAAWAWDLKFLIAKTLFAFGIGLLCWTAARHLPVAMLLAFSSAFIGFFSYRFIHPAFFSVSYAPWILLGWLRAGPARSLRRVAACALAVIVANWMELNSGTAKESSMILIALNGAGGIALLALSQSWRQRLKNLTIMSAGVVLFLALSAPLWVVFLDSLRRGVTYYDAPTAFQIQPALILGLFDDLFYRELMTAEWHLAPAANFMVLMGILWALVDFKKMRAEPVFACAGWAALPLLALIFGIVPPQCIAALPLLKNIWHVDNTFTCPLIVLLFVLAAFGLRNALEGMQDAPAWRVRWGRTLVLLALLAALYFGSANARTRWPVYAVQAAHEFAPSPFFIGYVIALFAAVAVLPLAVRRLRTGEGSRVAYALLAALSLFALHFRHGMWLETKFDYYAMNPRERMDLSVRSPAVAFVQTRHNEPSRIGSFGKILRPGFNVLYDLEGVAGSDAVGNHWYAEWLEAAGLSGQWMWNAEYGKESLPSLRPMLDAMNVRYYFGSLANQDHPAPGLKKVAVADLEIFESPAAWPRAFFTNRVSNYGSPGELLREILHSEGRPLAGMQNEPAMAALLGTDQESRQIVPAKDYRLTNRETSFTLEAPGAGLAVLTEAYEEKNFRVLVNGTPAPCLRVNHCFKGVFLPAAGRYAITFAYWPYLLTPALCAAAAALALLAVGAFVIFRRADM